MHSQDLARRRIHQHGAKWIGEGERRTATKFRDEFGRWIGETIFSGGEFEDDLEDRFAGGRAQNRDESDFLGTADGRIAAAAWTR